MLNKYVQFKPAYDLLLKLIIALSFTCALGPLTVSIPGEIPLTLQTFFLLLFAIGFGWKVGALNALLYVLFGMAGLPVFAGYNGGIENLSGSSGGFFFGFIAGALISGYMAESNKKDSPFIHIAAWFVGHAIILLLGGYWLSKFLPEIWFDSIKSTLPAAAIKSAVGFLIIQLLIRFLAGRNEFYEGK